MLAVTLAVQGACGGTAVTSRTLPSPIVQAKEEVLPKELVKAALEEGGGEAYAVGPGDALLVVVYGHPELSIAGYAGGMGGGESGRLSGLVVDNDGTIQFPLIGSVGVEGKTLEELRLYLEDALAVYIKDPKVTVQVAYAGSIRYYLLGRFTAPGLKRSDRPLKLLEALSLGGSISLENASLRTAYLARNGKRLPVNFRRLLLEGDLEQNVPLQSGDVIFVPDSSNEQAFVFGGTTGSNVRGGAVRFAGGRLTLLQALASAGFGFQERSQSRLSETRVIRSEGDRGTIYEVDASMIIAGDAAPFELMPGDIVYVPMTAFTSFNQALAQLMPTIQTVAGVLTPFVQLKYLSE